MTHFVLFTVCSLVSIAPSIATRVEWISALTGQEAPEVTREQTDPLSTPELLSLMQKPEKRDVFCSATLSFLDRMRDDETESTYFSLPRLQGMQRSIIKLHEDPAYLRLDCFEELPEDVSYWSQIIEEKIQRRTEHLTQINSRKARILHSDPLQDFVRVTSMMQFQSGQKWEFHVNAPLIMRILRIPSAAKRVTDVRWTRRPSKCYARISRSVSANVRPECDIYTLQWVGISDGSRIRIEFLGNALILEHQQRDGRWTDAKSIAPEKNEIDAAGTSDFKYLMATEQINEGKDARPVITDLFRMRT